MSILGNFYNEDVAFGECELTPSGKYIVPPVGEWWSTGRWYQSQRAMVEDLSNKVVHDLLKLETYAKSLQ